ncbi:MAG TPA: hypothetical protein VK576_00905, partial [Thermoleophilia bacterium]|nr:hypothetical protein [Thermoleophilia bacterium]
MTEQEVFILADRALLGVVEQIADDQWSMHVPAEMVHGRSGLTLSQVLDYHAYDEAWVPDTLAGRTIDEVGDAHAGDLLGDDPKASFARLVAVTRDTVAGFTDLDRTVHLSYGDWPAREYLTHITHFRASRVYDLSRFLGLDTTLPPELVQGLLWELEPRAAQWREFHVI